MTDRKLFVIERQEHRSAPRQINRADPAEALRSAPDGSVSGGSPSRCCLTPMPLVCETASTSSDSAAFARASTTALAGEGRATGIARASVVGVELHAHRDVTVCSIGHDELIAVLLLRQQRGYRRAAGAGLVEWTKSTTASSRCRNSSASPASGSHVQAACLPNARRSCKHELCRFASSAVVMSLAAGSDETRNYGSEHEASPAAEEERRAVTSTLSSLVLCTSELAVTPSGRVHMHRRDRPPAGR